MVSINKDLGLDTSSAILETLIGENPPYVEIFSWFVQEEQWKIKRLMNLLYHQTGIWFAYIGQNFGPEDRIAYRAASSMHEEIVFPLLNLFEIFQAEFLNSTDSLRKNEAFKEIFHRVKRLYKGIHDRYSWLLSQAVHLQSTNKLPPESKIYFNAAMSEDLIVILAVRCAVIIRSLPCDGPDITFLQEKLKKIATAHRQRDKEALEEISVAWHSPLPESKWNQNTTEMLIYHKRMTEMRQEGIHALAELLQDLRQCFLNFKLSKKSSILEQNSPYIPLTDFVPCNMDECQDEK